MKLIDLLVRELPKRGGWPEKQSHAWQDMDGEIRFGTTTADDFYPKERTLVEGRRSPEYHFVKEGDDIAVTRSEYESALAAAQQPVWNGEGLPPVGCECETKFRYRDSAEWVHFRCVAIDCGVAFGWTGKDAVTLEWGGYQFRPIISEADKKRESALDAIYGAIASAERAHNRSDEADKVYQAIAAGKVPGVKLSD